ncbi:tyrosine-type recombinase/integrase [Rubripirellula amarantea]|uniref:tyrosine-type recombinase/integrase n=1 Tax=Rubripirellula amarantea TaxID=2527999 RepID=UPI0011B81936
MMASLYKEKYNDKSWSWRIRFQLAGEEKTIRISKRSKRDAELFRRNLEDLVQAKQFAVSIRPELAQWQRELDPKIRLKLQYAGVIDGVIGVDFKKIRTIEAWCDHYINARADIAESTKENFRQVKRLLIEKFGVDKLVTKLKPADAVAWRRWLVARPMAPSTVSKHSKRAKQLFKEAVQIELIHTNPFEVLKGGDESNADRQWFVTEEDSQAILKKCPTLQWKLIFVLARYAGMRCPSEITRLSLEDILLDKGQMRIRSPKTGIRYCPIFPEIRPILLAQMDLTERIMEVSDGRLVYPHGVDVNLSTTMAKIIERAGVARWPRLFNNLRSTRRTELEDAHPAHVVDAWMGHDSKTAKKHYLQVTDKHVAKATGQHLHNSKVTDPKSDPRDAKNSAKRSKTNLEMSAPDRCRLRVTVEKLTPTGLEPVSPP